MYLFGSKNIQPSKRFPEYFKNSLSPSHNKTYFALQIILIHKSLQPFHALCTINYLYIYCQPRPYNFQSLVYLYYNCQFQMQKYRLIEEVGKGAFSEVFKAYDIHNHRFVAVKRFSFHIDDIRQKLIAEIETLKSSIHPNVIKLYEVVVQSSQVFLIFELQHYTLIEFYKQVKFKGRWLPQQTIKSYLYQIALALDHLHSNNIMHRDIKPENVMLKKGSKLIKLIDFGFCKKINQLPQTDYISTRWYRAPQLVLGMKYGLPVDIFALGCLMLELYNSVQVFKGKTSIDQIYKICEVLGNIKDWKQGSNQLKNLGIQIKFMPKRLHRLTTNMNRQAKQLLQQMLVFNPSKRITIQQVLSHQYFRSVQLPFEVFQFLRGKKKENNRNNNSPQNKFNHPNRQRIQSLHKHRRTATQSNSIHQYIEKPILIPPLPLIKSSNQIPSIPTLQLLPLVSPMAARTLNRYDSHHIIYTDRSSVQRRSVSKKLLTSREYKFIRFPASKI